MTIRPIATSCLQGSCPTIYGLPDETHVLVQGYIDNQDVEGLTLPTGEMVVKVPTSLILEAAAKLAASPH